MPLPRAALLSVDRDRPFSSADEAVDAGALLKPIIAGARARGVADGLELLGVGAVLIDDTGRVLHAGGRVRRMLGGYARIVGDHLVAERPADNSAFEALIGSAIGAGRHDPEARVTLEAGGGRGALSMRALRFASDEGEAQRLRVVLVLEESRPA